MSFFTISVCFIFDGSFVFGSSFTFVVFTFGFCTLVLGNEISFFTSVLCVDFVNINNGRVESVGLTVATFFKEIFFIIFSLFFNENIAVSISLYPFFKTLKYI